MHALAPLSCFPRGIEITKLLEFLPYCLNEDGSANVGLIEGLYARGVLVDGMRQNALREALKKNFKALPAASDKSFDKASDKASDKSSNKPNFIDSIDSMDSTQAAAAMLSALEVIRACVKKFANPDNVDVESALMDCEQLANVARLIAK